MEEIEVMSGADSGIPEPVAGTPVILNFSTITDFQVDGSDSDFGTAVAQLLEYESVTDMVTTDPIVNKLRSPGAAEIEATIDDALGVTVRILNSAGEPLETPVRVP